MRACVCGCGGGVVSATYLFMILLHKSTVQYKVTWCGVPCLIWKRIKKTGIVVGSGVREARRGWVREGGEGVNSLYVLRYVGACKCILAIDWLIEQLNF